MIQTGEIVLAFLSLGDHRPRRNKNLNVSGEYDSLIAIKSPSFFVGKMFWACIGISLNFYLSETPPSKLGGIFQMYCLISFAHSSPQQAEGYPALFL